MTEATMTREEQALQALALANEARSGRAQLKRDVRMGVVDVRDLIRNPPELLRTGPKAAMPVTIGRLLTWQPHWGDHRAQRFLKPLRVAPYTTPFDLTQTRREQVARALG